MESLPTRGAWIEIFGKRTQNLLDWSLPPRGAWIEIGMKDTRPQYEAVAPHTGSVD